MSPLRHIHSPMLLRDYRKLANVSLADMLEKLRSVANPGELDKTRRTTILRHETGERFPGSRMQALYELATDRAVMPEDHVLANREYEAAKGGQTQGG